MNILIIKASALGDIIQAFPVLHYLHQLYPNARIDWVVEEPFKEVLQAHPLVHRVLTIQTKKWRRQLGSRETWQEIKLFSQALRDTNYDLVFDLQGNAKSSMVLALTKGTTKIGFGYQTVPEKINLLFTDKRYNPPTGRNIREDYLFLAQSACGDFNQASYQVDLALSLEENKKIQQTLSQASLQGGLVAMVCPGSNWPNKQLAGPALGTFLRQVQSRLGIRYLFIWGSQHEKEMAEELAASFPEKSVVADSFSLPALQGLMRKVDLIVAMDSLPLHLAGTTATPTFSFFGPSLAHKYRPLGPQHQAFQGKCPYDKQFKKRCPLLRSCSTGACLKGSSEQELFANFLNWWQSYLKVCNR